MKDSGVEWIGEIPEDWSSKRLKFLCEISTGTGDTQDKNDEGQYPFFVRSEKPKHIDFYTHNCLAILTAGDGDVGNIWHYIDGKFTAHQRVYIFNNFEEYIYPRYLYYYLKGLFILQPVLLQAKTTVASLRLPMLKEFPVLLSDINEQEKIAIALDLKIDKINSIISDTQQSIIELKRYKQSLITETVTKGLDKTVEMKDSGIEWIGEVPENWFVTKLNNLFTIKKEIANELGYDILSVTQHGLKIKDIENNSGQMSADYSKYQIVEPENFVMNHMDLLTGWIDISQFVGVTSPDYRVFKCKEKTTTLNKYYLYIFQICYSNRIFYGLGQGVSNVGRWRLQTDKFLNFYLPLPSIKEQQQIVEFLDNKTSKIDSLIADKEKMITEYESYKKSLIYEYVTGKKQV